MIIVSKVVVMASKLVLILVAFVGFCAAAPNAIPDGDSVLVNYDMDALVKAEAAAGRIVGGTPTTVNAYPWIVQMDSFSTWGTWGQSCGANILNSLFVLSAAHCTHIRFDPNYRPENRRIRAGATNRNSGGAIINVQSVLNHPSFVPTRDFDADICIIRLRSNLSFGNTIQAVSIVPQGYNLADNVAVVHAGWGAIRTDGPASNVLLQVTVNSINNALCRQRYQAANPPATVTNNMICAGILNVGGRDACQGDSGGPLYLGNTLVGVVSWGFDCADPHFPGVSARVGSYTTWIVNNAR